MSSTNPQAVTTGIVQTVYDLLQAHYNTSDTALPEGAMPDAYARGVLEQVLGEIGYQRAPNAPSILKAHDAKVARGKASRAVTAGSCQVTADLFRDAAGCDLPEAMTGPATEDDTQSAETTETAAAEAGDTAGADADDTAACAPIAAQTYDVEAGEEELINPTIETVTGGKITDISAFLGKIHAAQDALATFHERIAAHDAAIADFQAGRTPEAEPDDGEITFTPSGLAGLEVSHAMVRVLDSQLQKALTPAATIDELIAQITAAETGIEKARTSLRERKRALRRARPRQSVKVAGPAVEAGTLDAVDALNADCEVIHETASDLFPRCYGANPEILGFEVPRLDFGAPHPDVPQVDPSFRFFTGVLPEALSAIADNEIVWLYGDSGCGKSEFWSQVAAHLNMPFTRLNLDGHLTRGDVVGGMKLVSDGKGGQETRFVEGALPRAMARPGLLLIDEFDLGDPEIMPIFQPVLEGKPLVLLEDGGRIVRPHPMFRIAITGNTVGLGSENQMYLNVFEQSAATRDRIAAFVQMPYLPGEIEKEVVLQRIPDADEEFIEKLVQLAGKVRSGYASREIHSLFSTRAVQACARRYTRFAPLYPNSDQAAQEILQTVILNRLDDASHQVVKGLIDNIF